MSYDDHIKSMENDAKIMTLGQYFKEYGKSMDVYEMWVFINKEMKNAKNL